VSDTRDGLTERRELFRLQQFMVEIAGLIFGALAIAHVAHERAFARCRDFHPDEGAVVAAQPQEVIDDLAVGVNAREKGFARVLIREAFGVKWIDETVGRVGRVAEHPPQAGIRSERVRVGDRADVHALRYLLEKG
jgi:hypothetical protein